jgi:hypothetical protein
MSETDNIARGNHVVPIEWAQQLERERDEAREELNEARSVADELSAIAARYLGWHLSRTPMGPDDDHLAQASRITETLARWKTLASA